MSHLRALLAAILVIAPAAAPATAADADAGLSPSEASWRLLLMGRWDEVVTRCEDRLAAEPGDLRAAACLAEALFRSGGGERARDRWKDVDPDAAPTAAPAIAAGTIAYLERDFPRAETLFRSALERTKAGGSAPDQLVAHERLGTALREAGQPQQAEEELTAARDLLRQLDRPVTAAWLEYGIGYTHMHVGRTDESEPYLRRALQGASRLDLYELEGDTQVVLSLLPLWRMELDKSREHLYAALEAYRKTGNLARQASCYRHLGGRYVYGGEMVDAVRVLLIAKELAERAGDRMERSRALAELGHVALSLGDPARAIERWREALEEGEGIWPPEWSGAYQLDVANALMELEEYEPSLEWLRKARATLEKATHRRDLAEVHTGFARSLRETGHPAEAIQAAEEGKRIAREWDHPLALCGALTETGKDELALGRLEEAERAFFEADSTAGERGFPQVRIAARVGRARVARASGRSSEALGLLEEGIEIAEDRRRLSRGSETMQQRVFGTSIPLFVEAIDLLEESSRAYPDSGFDRRAFEMAQRAKARSLLDLLSEADVDLRLRADPAFRERERTLLESESGPELEEELMLLEADVRAADPRYAELRYPRPRTAAEIQEGLSNEGELLVEYLLGETVSFAWAVTDRSFRMARLPGRAEIAALVQALLPLLSDYNLLGPDPSYLRAPADRLYQILLGPFAAEMAQARHLVVAPDDALHFLPFEVLAAPSKGREKPGNDWASFPFLVKRIDVSYVPSASTLEWMERKTSAEDTSSSTDLLLVGDPLTAEPPIYLGLQGTERDPAPYSREEVEVLLRRFPASHSLALIGRDATSSRLSQACASGHYRLVHFASHGVFNERRPRFSGLLLSPDSESDDGFLSLDEVFALDLECDQVVLSACSSALGKPVSGEGLIGLTRAFLYAGARSVVASLWKVSGEATADLMDEFYGELETGHGDRAKALSETKRRFIAAARGRGEARYDAGHPYFWAPFVLVGDPGE